MQKIFNFFVKWGARCGIAALAAWGWDQVGKPCDTATKENRYVGGRATSNIVNKVGPPAAKAATDFLGQAALAAGQAFGESAAESMQKKG